MEEDRDEDVEELDASCSLYITPVDGEDLDSALEKTCMLKQVRNILRSSKISGKWKVLDTNCGVLVLLSEDRDAERLMNTIRSAILKAQIVQLNGKRSFPRQAVFLREVPWAIQLNDLREALNRQGITMARVERKRHHVRVEVCEPEHYESLLKRGLNFFGAIRFQAIPDRGVRSHTSWHDPSSTLSSDPNFVLQCYRCQGFWHIAANCRHEVRCVRCGEHHSVHYCPRPRSDPVCCHCSGPHHAAYRYCPVRLDLVNAIPISLTLSTRRHSRHLPHRI